MSFPTPPPPPPPLSGLAHGLLLPTNPAVKGQWFNKKTFRIDGWTFEHCRFDGCVLHVATTSFKFERCHVDENTLIVFEGDLLNVVRLFHIRNEFMKNNIPHFAPTFHDDGTISVGTI